jgi:hypothetical protein
MTSDFPNGTVAKVEHNASTKAALAETLRQLPKKSAQEALGLPVGTGLLVPFTVAAIGIMLSLIVLTAIPYAMAKVSTTSEKPAVPDSTEKQEQPATTQPPSAPTTSNPTPDSSSKVNPKVPGKGDILDKLGENGKKIEKPNVNPLDKKDDDLLKDIK